MPRFVTAQPEAPQREHWVENTKIVEQGGRFYCANRTRELKPEEVPLAVREMVERFPLVHPAEDPVETCELCEQSVKSSTMRKHLLAHARGTLTQSSFTVPGLD